VLLALPEFEEKRRGKKKRMDCPVQGNTLQRKKKNVTSGRSHMEKAEKHPVVYRRLG